MWLTSLATSHFLSEQYEPSLRIVEKILNLRPRWTYVLALKAANLARLGRLAEAHAIQDDVRRIKPDFNPANIQTAVQEFASEDLAKLTRALSDGGWTWD